MPYSSGLFGRSAADAKSMQFKDLASETQRITKLPRISTKKGPFSRH